MLGCSNNSDSAGASPSFLSCHFKFESGNVATAVFVNVLFRSLFSHAVCMLRCCTSTTEEIYSVPRKFICICQNIGCQSQIMLVLNGSVTKCIVSWCDEHVISAHYTWHIVSVYKNLDV